MHTLVHIQSYYHSDATLHVLYTTVPFRFVTYYYANVADESDVHTCIQYILMYT